MSSVFYIKNVVSFLDSVRKRNVLVEPVPTIDVSPFANVAPRLMAVPHNEAEIRLRNDTVGTARRIATVKAQHEIL